MKAFFGQRKSPGTIDLRAADKKRIDKLCRTIIGEPTETHAFGAVDETMRAKAHLLIYREIKRLRKAQSTKKDGTKAYGDLDSEIRTWLLKEIQIIIDLYMLAMKNGNPEWWATLYGDIEHYKRSYFYYRMGSGYDQSSQALTDYRIVNQWR